MTYGQKLRYGLVALPVLAASQVQAAVPTEITDAITTGKADMSTVAGLMLAVVVALIAFKLIRRALS
jgi:hypothetical protein